MVRKSLNSIWGRRWILALTILALTSLFGCQSNNDTSAVVTTGQTNQVEDSQEPSVSYEVVNVDNNSRKAMTESLSSYTIQELEALPTYTRSTYRVTVPATIKQTQVEPTLRKIVSDVTASDPDLDELTVFMYSDAQAASSAYDVGRAVWANKGEYGNITPEIARNNDRSNYSTTVDVVPDVEAYLTQRNKQEDKFGFTEEQRRAIFKEMVAAEDKAYAVADEVYPLNVDVSKNTEYVRELQAQYLAELRAEHGYTEEIELDIKDEGLRENWALE